MLIKDRIEKLKNFHAIKLRIENEEMILVLKTISSYQKEFIFKYYLKNLNTLSEEDRVELLLYCLEGSDRDTCVKINNNPDAFYQVINILFQENDLSLDFTTTMKDQLEEVLSNRNKLISSLKVILLGFGYKIIDLRDLSQQDLMFITLEELLFRDPQKLATFVETICLDPTKEEDVIREDRMEIFDTISKFIKEAELQSLFESKKSTNTGISGFEQLSQLG